MIEIGETKLVQGSGKEPYKVKNIDGDGFSCTCTGWKMCRAETVNNKECKHTKPERVAFKRAHGIAQAPVTFVSIDRPTPVGRSTPAVDGASDSSRMESLDSIWGSLLSDPWNSAWSTEEIYDAALAETRTLMQGLEEARLGRKMRPDELSSMFGPPCILAHTYGKDAQPDPANWLWSEKKDGVRSYWTGRRLMSRQGNVYRAPDWFTANLPRDVKTDGELWVGRQKFNETISVVKSGPSENWKKVSYVLYDLPDHPGTFEDRYAALESMFPTNGSGHIRTLSHTRVSSTTGMFETLDKLVVDGAEGIMIRNPHGAYEAGRSRNLLKLKPWHDAEAMVVGYNDGKGSNKGVCGGLVCEMPNGKRFSLGQLTAEQRRNPPSIGSHVTYKYTELTKDLIPKCASLIGVRDFE